MSEFPLDRTEVTGRQTGTPIIDTAAVIDYYTASRFGRVFPFWGWPPLVNPFLLQAVIQAGNEYDQRNTSATTSQELA